MVSLPFNNCTAFPIDNYGHVPFYMEEMFVILENITACWPDYPGLVEWNGMTAFSPAEIARITGNHHTGIVASIWYFTPYQLDLFLGRFQIWKVPLIQLLMLFPRPPHGAAVELMSLFHLMGDPIDTIASLIFTLQITQNRLRSLGTNGMSRKKLEELTLLIMAFEEVGSDEIAVSLEEAWVLSCHQLLPNYN